MATLSLSGVKKSYDNVEVLKKIQLDVEAGEFIVVLGPSGCGKSTLLRSIAGLEQIDDGEISIAGKVVNDIPPRDRNIAMVFQNYALYPHMTVFDNIAYGLKIRGLAPADINAKVQAVAEKLHLEKLLQRKPKALSGGQRQRVAMGRAIVRDPTLFLFDEPLSNLDAALRVKMRKEIKALHREFNTTSIYVTHDQTEALTLASRVVLMNGGIIQQVGTPLELYNKPANRFVGQFIGSPGMNFAEAMVNDDGSALLIGPQLQFALRHPLPRQLAKQPIVVGIRPESLVPLAAADNGLVFEVNDIEALGSDTLAYGHLLGIEQPWCVRLDAAWYQNPTKTVTLSVLPDRLHLFDFTTGQRIVSRREGE